MGGVMRIGESVIWRGRRYVVRGFEPMSVANPHADLEDATVGTTVHAPISELDHADPDPEPGIDRPPPESD